ncbi:hypothetical protein N186_07915 [Thermofilum adornatum]|uniref:Uncharacterized protein n=1 Tax=Thermofilum adornatum TaxID=1365176 RepID=S5ZMU8_9CREN|nr:hypothetical protein N186_07915 [Thermofilum adornatum]
MLDSSAFSIFVYRFLVESRQGPSNLKILAPSLNAIRCFRQGPFLVKIAGRLIYDTFARVWPKFAYSFAGLLCEILISLGAII